MKEQKKKRPITFSTDMVKAILEGRKTQTRRICIDQTAKSYTFGTDILAYPTGQPYTGWVKDCGQHFLLQTKCPYGKVGDRLWVRETYVCGKWGKIKYKADYKERPAWVMQWGSPIYMPKDISRITLEITDIRVERLQEISEEDAKAEGMVDYELKDPPKGGIGYSDKIKVARIPQGQFAKLWNSIYKKENRWEDNPWCWCVSFKKLEQKKGR